MATRKIFNCVLALVLAVALSIPVAMLSAPTQAYAATTSIEEIAGATRYDTAIVTAQKAYPNGASGVIIVYGLNFPDALTASSLAGQKDYPILYSALGSLTEATVAEVQRLGAQEAIIVGGESVVSSNVVSQLKSAMGTDNVTRYSGSTRIETAESVFGGLVASGQQSDTIIIATSSDFADATSIASYAVKTNSPILLTAASGTLTSSTKEILEENAPSESSADVSGLSLDTSERDSAEDDTVYEDGSSSDSDPAVSEQTIDEADDPTNTQDGEEGDTAVATAAETGQTLDVDTAADVAADNILETAATDVAVDAVESGEAMRAQTAGSDGFKNILIVGGTSVVSEEVEAYCRDQGYNVTRLAGDDRYLTSQKVVSWCVGTGGMTYSNMGIASGSSFADALTGSVLQGEGNNVILLTDEFQHALVTLRTVLTSVDPANVRVFGGTSVITQTVRNEILYGPLPANDATDTATYPGKTTAATTVYLAPSTSSPVVTTWSAGKTGFSFVKYDAAGVWYVSTLDGQKVYIQSSTVEVASPSITTLYPITLSAAALFQQGNNPRYNNAVATLSQVMAYMDPGTVGVSDYYQFAVISSYSGMTAADLNKMLAGCGAMAGQGEAFVAAAKAYGVNEVYLVAHAILETGYGTSTLAKGWEYEGKTYYNFFGYGAYDDSPLSGGQAAAVNYGWTSPEIAIDDCARRIALNYIHNRGQDTLYKMRWAPAAMVQGSYGYQYATDIAWAEKIAILMTNTYKYATTTTYVTYDVPAYL